MGGRGASSGSNTTAQALAKVDRLIEQDHGAHLSNVIKSPIPIISRSEADKLTRTWSRMKTKDRRNLPEEEVPISKVATWQSWVDGDGVKRIIKGENTEHQGKNTSPIYAMLSNGKYVLMDGNHRVVADLLMGKKKVKIKVYRGG